MSDFDTIASNKGSEKPDKPEQVKPTVEPVDWGNEPPAPEPKFSPNPAPSNPGPTPPASTEPPQSGKKKTWIIIVIVVVLLCCLCLVAGAAILYFSGAFSSYTQILPAVFSPLV